ncbi:ribonuclease H-like domain-containing protein [Tanacetum coccineum]|uniref:Ribonuclease H-like domain-containing protein n=1 Tax=Tanacetum coccineum TaxID=301880 RepID=A0ABQ4YQZ5_9ASTR
MEPQLETTQTVYALKLPVLKTNEYDLWSMRMEQYLTFTDHALWEVIVNGDSVSPVASASTGAECPIPPKTAEQKLAKKNELKAKSTLMLAIHDEHLLKFHACKDEKSLWEAIKNRNRDAPRRNAPVDTSTTNVLVVQDGIAVATKSGQVLVNAAKQSSPRAASLISTVRPVNTIVPKVKLGVNNVTTARPKAVVNAVEGKGENVVKLSRVDGGFVCIAVEVFKKEVIFLDHKGCKTSGTLKLLNCIENQINHKVLRGNLVLLELHNKMEFGKQEKNRTLNRVSMDYAYRFTLTLLHFEAEVVKYACYVHIGLIEEPANEVKEMAREKEGYANSNNKVSTVSPFVSAVGQSFDNADDLLTDPLMPDLSTASLPNDCLDSHTKYTRSSKRARSMEDINLATQTRMMTKFPEEYAMKVWTLVDLPNGKRAIGTKWVYRNKKDERGIIVRNKARLVAQGYTQEEGIDYDEVFALVARIEAIRLFLAYASFMRFIVYQMDVKSAFLYGTIEEEFEADDAQEIRRLWKVSMGELTFLFRCSEDSKHSNKLNIGIAQG